MNKKTLYILLGIFLLSLGIRLYFAFSTPYYSTDEAYFVLRQVENVLENGDLLTYDDLSFSGREHAFNPFYYILLSFFGLFFPLAYVFKIVPNILASLLIPIVYFIAYELTKDTRSSLFTSFICAFIPIYFSETVNSISQLSFTIPMIFFSIYCFMKIDKRSYLHLFLASIFILTFTTPLTLLLVFSLLIYLLFTKIEDFSNRKAETELVIFSLIFVLWINFVLYRPFFLHEGILNALNFIPKGLWLNYFSEINMLVIIYKIGIIPLTYGVYAIYSHIFFKKEKSNYILIAFIFATVILLWARIATINTSLILLGVGMSVLFATFYKQADDYWKKTKFHRYKNIGYLMLFILFLSTSVFPTLTYSQEHLADGMAPEKIKMYEWLNKRTDEGDVILSNIKDGHLISGIAKRKNIQDSNFFFIDDLEERSSDIKDFYTALYETQALRITTKYDINYVVFNEEISNTYGIEELSFITDRKCFKPIFGEDDLIVYEVGCTI